MTGKVFPESNNIYQDQAKILFNYYRNAAEKIVSEEERIENEISSLKADIERINKEKDKLWVWFLTVVLFFVYFIKKNSCDKQIVQIENRIDEYKKEFDNIFRDYKVTKLGVMYVPVADQIKYEDKSFIVDYTGNVSESEVTLQLSRQNELLSETIKDLESLSKEAPIVETSEEVETIETDDYSRSIQEINQNDYFGKLDRSLRTIAFCMDDLDTTSVSLPLVSNNSEFLQYLNEYSTTEIPDNAVVMEVFDKKRYADSINKFQELNKLKDSLSKETNQFEDVLKNLMVTMANSVQAISMLKVASTDKIVFESNKILYQILKSSYNHYSPVLEHEEIEKIRNEKFDYNDSIQGYEPFNLKQSSRVRYNITTGMWTAEDGSTTFAPFGVPQIYEEIVAPIIQNLMMENRIERMKIYSHIKDQKLSYLNKWHQDTDSFYMANRAESSNIINLMQESLREYVAAYNTLVSLKKTEESMKTSGGQLDKAVVEVNDNTVETLAAFEAQSKDFQQVQNDFEEYIERLKEDIDNKAEKFGHIEFYDAKLRDGNANEIAVATDEICSLDERRKPLATINPLLAKVSNLPPKPQIEDITYEQLSINLPTLAKNALDELNNEVKEEAEEEKVEEENNVEENIVEEKVEEKAEEEVKEEETSDDEETVMGVDNEEDEELEEDDSDETIADDTDDNNPKN